MTDFEVPEAIICSPCEEPAYHWHLEEGVEPEKRKDRRPAVYYYPDQRTDDAKGYDDRADVKAAAAQRWVDGVNADGRFGIWSYEIASKVDQVRQILADRQVSA